jgi:hypothetical protein
MKFIALTLATVTLAACGSSTAPDLGTAGQSAHGPSGPVPPPLVPRLPVQEAQCLPFLYADLQSALQPGGGSGYEGFGVSDITAQTANGAMAVAENGQGTLTVLKWPSPSYNDLLKYFTVNRDLPYAGALPNEGQFFGVIVDGKTYWLRDWEAQQSYSDMDSDAIVTRLRNASLGLTVVVRDVVAASLDVLVRRVEVEADDVAHRPTGLVAFENFQPTAMRVPGVNAWDWCAENLAEDRASFIAADDVIVHQSTPAPDVDAYADPPLPVVRSVAVGMGFDQPSAQHQVGLDAYWALPLPQASIGPLQDAYLDAADGVLSGNALGLGQTDGALIAPLEFNGTHAAVELYVAAGSDSLAVSSAIQQARVLGYERIAKTKRQQLLAELAGAPLPDTDDSSILRMAKRALILLLTSQDRNSGAIVAAISTQPPYGEDWPRDGTFFNRALLLARRYERVRAHNRFYVRTQSTLLRQPFGAVGPVPPGCWGMAYYADGMVGLPTQAWEIDECGLGGFTLFDLYAHTGRLDDLRSAWPAIERSAEFFVLCSDPLTGLQCPAVEDDDTAPPAATATGAMAGVLALDAAARAAETLGLPMQASRYRERRAQLAQAIDAQLWDEKCGCYTVHGDQAQDAVALLWPQPLRDPADLRMQGEAEHLWQMVAASIAAPGDGKQFGLYESAALLGAARIWRLSDPARLADIRRGLHWIADVQATPGTGLIGETWYDRGGHIQTDHAIPHLWEHTLFYLAALEAYGARAWTP